MANLQQLRLHRQHCVVKVKQRKPFRSGGDNLRMGSLVPKASGVKGASCVRSAVISVIWTALLIASNWLVYLAGPKVEQVSGNGVPPEQFVAILLSFGFTIGWMVSLRRAAGRLSAQMSDDARIKASLIAWIVGGGLALWAMDVSSQYQELFYDVHRRELPMQHAATYWAITWQFWAALGCATLATGIWLGVKRADGQGVRREG